MIAVTVNGEPREAAEGVTVGSLLDALGLGRQGVAVELNGDIVKRAQWDTTPLGQGSRLEVVHFVGGG